MGQEGQRLRYQADHGTYLGSSSLPNRGLEDDQWAVRDWGAGVFPHPGGKEGDPVWVGWRESRTTSTTFWMLCWGGCSRVNGCLEPHISSPPEGPEEGVALGRN